MEVDKDSDLSPWWTRAPEAGSPYLRNSVRLRRMSAEYDSVVMKYDDKQYVVALNMVKD